MRSITAAAALLAVCACVTPQTVSAQGAFDEQCTAQRTSGQLRDFCMRVGQGIEIVEPRLGIAMSGGNPVPGTASTLGMRLGTLPRISVGVRGTAALAETPPIEEISGGDALKFPLPSLNVDASVGVFSGLSILPTVGGFGSVDLLGSVGYIPLPQGEGFGDDKPVSWAVGARVGLLRESFTAPGISVSGMYRKLGTVSYGDSAFTDRDAYFAIDDLTALSVRGTIGKRIPLIGLGLTVGAGYDRYNAAASFAVRDPSLLTGATIAVREDDLETSRMSYFANASWTFIIVNIVGELGVQEGGRKSATSAIGTDALTKGGIFGGFAVRIAL